MGSPLLTVYYTKNAYISAYRRITAVYLFLPMAKVCRTEKLFRTSENIVFFDNNYPKIVGVALAKKWSGRNLTDLTSDYWPAYVRIVHTRRFGNGGWYAMPLC